MHYLFTITAIFGPDSDWTGGSNGITVLNFRSFDRDISVESFTITIVDNSFAEPPESLICSIQAGVVESVQTVDPKQLTIEIVDNEGKRSGMHGGLH